MQAFLKTGKTTVNKSKGKASTSDGQTERIKPQAPWVEK